MFRVVVTIGDGAWRARIGPPLPSDDAVTLSSHVRELLIHFGDRSTAYEVEIVPVRPGEELAA